MNYILDVIIIILLFSGFGFIHSYMASRKFKRKLIESIGDRIAFYRSFYNASSLIVFIAAYALSPKPNLLIYDLVYPYDIIIFGLQVLSLFGIVWAAFYINLEEFTGISQLKRYYNGNYDIKEFDEKTELVKKGPFSFSRHPIYLFSILFLGFRPYMNLFYLVLFLTLTAYFVAGTYFEERKLVEIFGEEYKDYQNKVSHLIPYVY